MMELPEPVAAALADRLVVEAALGDGLIVTFAARDLARDRAVLLKLPRPDLALALEPHQFIEAMKRATALRHPHVVPIEACESAGSYVFYVTPRPEGVTLRDRLSAGPLAVEDALRIARDAARGLHHGHEQGLRHGYVRPETVLVTDRGSAVTDYGVLPALHEAKRAGPDLPQALPYYASPELADPYAEPDARSDLYSLGCVLFEMLTGEPPYRGASATIIMSQHKGAPIPDLARIRPDVPPAVRAVVQRALAKEPSQRFQSGVAFVLSLEEEMASRPDMPLLAETGEEAQKKRGRGCLGMVLGIVASLLAAAVWLFAARG